MVETGQSVHPDTRERSLARHVRCGYLRPFRFQYCRVEFFGWVSSLCCPWYLVLTPTIIVLARLLSVFTHLMLRPSSSVSHQATTDWYLGRLLWDAGIALSVPWQ